jgi:hypothetical protein
MTPHDVADGLRRGDFTRLAPLFGDPAQPERATGQLLSWVEQGEFTDDPHILAEALTCACFLGQTGVGARLLERGVDPAAGMGTGMSALHWAANRGQRAAVVLLLSHGAPMELHNMYEGTALGAAVWAFFHERRGDQLGVIRALLEAGADARAVEFPTGRPEVDALLAPYRSAL